MDKLVTISSFSHSVELEMIKSYLESFEIQCFVKDEWSNQTNVTLLNGGIKLQVYSVQAEEAIRLLIEKGYLKPEDFEPSAEMKWIEKIITFFKRK